MKYLLFFIACFPLYAAAQLQPVIAAKTVFGGKKQDAGTDVETTFGGDVAVLGNSRSSPALGQDALLSLYSPGLDLMWSKHYGGPHNDHLNAVAQTDDGGFVMAGYYNNPSTNQEDAWILKTNEKGDTLWNRFLPGERNQRFSDIIETERGELLATGYSYRDGQQKMWLYRCYADGAFKKEYLYGDKGKNEGLRVRQGVDGNYGLVGMTTSGKGGRKIRLLSLTQDFDPIGHHMYGSRQWEEINDMIAFSDGGFLLVGATQSTIGNAGNGGKDFWVVRTDAAGELIWENTYGGVGDDTALGITESATGTVLAFGRTYSHLMGANTSKALVITLNPNGEQIGEPTYFGGKGNDLLGAATCLADGSVLAVGTTNSKREGAQRDDGWLVRLRSNLDLSRPAPSRLTVTDLRLEEAVGDGTLEQQEDAFITLTLRNEGTNDAYDLILDGEETTGLAGVQLRGRTHIPYIRSGASLPIRLPARHTAEVNPTEVVFRFSVSDASRNRSEVVELEFPVAPINIPSNYLDARWRQPNVGGDSIIKVYESTLPISVKARSDRKLLRRYFNVNLNGSPYRKGGKAGEAELKKKASSGVFDYDFTQLVALAPGLNNIEVTIDNGSANTTTKVLRIEYSEKPNLHVLAIGIDHDDLKYTGKDAKDFASSFTGQQGRLFDRVHLTTLTSGARTPAGRYQTTGEVIKNSFATLRESYQFNIYENDLLVVFISSHGRTIDRRFKIVPTDGYIGEDEYIDYADDILAPLESLNCHKLLFIDACHSGGSGEEDEEAILGMKLIDERSRALNDLMGASKSTNTIASCQADESSWEDDRWENGAFTEALVGAFRNEAFEDKVGSFRPSQEDDIITVAELYAYLARRVPAMIIRADKKGSQHPYLAKEQLERAGELPIFEF